MHQRRILLLCITCTLCEEKGYVYEKPSEELEEKLESRLGFSDDCTKKCYTTNIDTYFANKGFCDENCNNAIWSCPPIECSEFALGTFLGRRDCTEKCKLVDPDLCNKNCESKEDLLKNYHFCSGFCRNSNKSSEICSRNCMDFIQIATNEELCSLYCTPFTNEVCKCEDLEDFNQNTGLCLKGCKDQVKKLCEQKCKTKEEFLVNEKFCEDRYCEAEKSQLCRTDDCQNLSAFTSNLNFCVKNCEGFGPPVCKEYCSTLDLTKQNFDICAKGCRSDAFKFCNKECLRPNIKNVDKEFCNMCHPFLPQYISPKCIASCGQLKSKNGQKYIVNERHEGVYVSKSCAILSVIIAVLSILIAILITYFLTINLQETISCNGNYENNTIAAAGMFTGSINEKNVQIQIEDAVPEIVKIKEIKLHDGWNPEMYTLIIEPNIQTSINNGSVTIQLTKDTNIKGLKPIVFDINNITIDNVRVTRSTKSSEAIKFESGYGDDNDSYFIKITSGLEENENVSVEVYMEFTSQLTNTLQGIYKTNYINAYTGGEEWMISTQFSPIDARRAFPCIDRPDKKANFSISIVHDSNLAMALSNMPSLSQNFYRPGYIKEEFKTTPKMPTYLVAFVVSNLVKSNISSNFNDLSPRIEVWTRPEVSKMTKFGFELARKLLPYYEKFFAIPFQLEKIDLVSVPDFGYGAMENWGLITFRDSTLLVPEGDLTASSSASNTRNVAYTIAHEIAHQWFGNLVTPKWWDDLWLKEGFASYTSALALENIYPDWEILDSWPISAFASAMQEDCDKNSHAILFPVENSIDIRRIFDSISYSKGGIIIRMVNSFIGDDAFKAAIQDFLKIYSYSNADRDDLWKLMTYYGHQLKSLPQDMDIKEIIDSWTQQPGYPIVTVSRNETDIIIKQNRYLVGASNSTDSSKWVIPITYASDLKRPGDTIPSYWLNDDEMVIHDVFSSANDSDNYVYLNLNRMGYYRVNYDYKLWIELYKRFKELPKITRAQLVDDALHLARINFLSYDVPLTFLLKLESSYDDYLLWEAVDESLEYLTFMLNREPAFETFRALIKYIVRPAFAAYSLDEPENESHLNLMHRSRVAKLACKFNYDRCTNAAQSKYREWMVNANDNMIKPNLKQTIYCTALQEGSFQEWYFAYKRYKESTSASEKEVILSAMGCTSKPWLLSKYLNMTIDPAAGIRKQDGARAFTAVSKNPIGYEIAFDFLATNIERISEYYGDGFSTLSSMIESLTFYMNKDYQLAQLKEFAIKAKSLGLHSIARTIDLAEEKVKNNIEWRARTYYDLKSYLEALVKENNINIY